MAMRRTKQQIQILVLGLIAIVAVVFILIQFLLVPLINEWKRNKVLAREAQAKLEEYRTVIRSRTTIQDQIDVAHEKIREASAYIPLPVLGNYLLGMETQLRAWAQDLDVRIMGVTENDTSELDGSVFKVYRVRVIAQCGYHDLARYLRVIEANNPWISVSGITVIPRADSPDKHDVTLMVAWLIWADPTKRPAFLMKANSEGKKN